ncbi:hypothetical protein [Streptomyces sp. CB03234]|uniref:hypothetical protein n=1 Tax=Streptomyces sp. (strain CB03234) TaxID=1703937 RepID=UPI0009A1907F|nr:hypothetical protein [Streptomyces sp. CB03234]
MHGMTSFEDIYDRPDPRAYFARLAPLSYEIPHHAQAVFRRTLAERAEPGLTVLDLCCSYGINAALLNHDLTLADLYAHYTSPEVQRLTTAELIERDKDFYAARRRPDAVRVVGLDIAQGALDYARAVGLLDGVHAVDLEEHAPPPALTATMADVGLITLTGGASFLSRRTFAALLECARRPVWVSAFALRTVTYAPIASCLAGFGLTTRTDPERTYPQRLFTSPQERRAAISAVRLAGLDPTGREAEGRYHAALYESRP